jgi:FkbM family methyltransferase
MGRSIEDKLDNIILLLEKNLESNKYLERRLSEILTSPFGLRSMFAHKKASCLEKDQQLNFDFNNISFRFYLPNASTDFIQQKILIEERFYEADLLEKIFTRKKYYGQILDIGANIGNHSIYFAKIAEFDHIVCIEPQDNIRSILEKNLILNGINNATVLSYAIGSSIGLAAPSHSSTHNSGAILVKESVHGSIPMRTIDSLGLSPTFMKIDVEGYEEHVLLGAIATLEAHHPDIWIEVFDRNFIKIDNLLKTIGYCQILSLPGSNYLYEFTNKK